MTSSSDTTRPAREFCTSARGGKPAIAAGSTVRAIDESYRFHCPGGTTLRIWIDADAAPREVKELVFRSARRLDVPVTLVANQRLQPPAGIPQVSAVWVEGGADVADKYIEEHAEAGDLVVTQDVPLAALLVPKGIAVLDPRGEEHTPETIGERLSIRDFMERLRGTGAVTGGPAPYDSRARQAFAAALDRVLTRLRRQAKSG